MLLHIKHHIVAELICPISGHKNKTRLLLNCVVGSWLWGDSWNSDNNGTTRNEVYGRGITNIKTHRSNIRWNRCVILSCMYRNRIVRDQRNKLLQAGNFLRWRWRNRDKISDQTTAAVLDPDMGDGILLHLLVPDAYCIRTPHRSRKHATV